MQERYRNDPWALLVGCILFNMVRGSSAQPVHEEFLRIWPNALKLVDAIEDNVFVTLTRIRMERLLKPLGLFKRRTDSIIKMSEDFLRMRPDVNHDVDVKELRGCGKYASDSFEIFVRGNIVRDVTDKELRRYVEWASAHRSNSQTTLAMVANTQAKG